MGGNVRRKRTPGQHGSGPKQGFSTGECQPRRQARQLSQQHGRKPFTGCSGMLSVKDRPVKETSGASGSGARSRRSITGKGLSITASQLQTLLDSQTVDGQCICALTGRALTPDVAVPDHIVPICRNGPNLISNLQIVHKDANKAKHGMSQQDFIALCREVADWSRR